jgi:hypothetical protein
VEGQLVHLHDHAVDLVLDTVAVLAEVLDEADRAIHAVEDPVVG